MASDHPKTEANTVLRQAAAEAGLQFGQVLLNRYEVSRVLGRGAMGEVLEVRDRQSGVDYALKRVPSDLVRDAAQMAGIRANFALVSKLTHPHIGTTRQLELDPASGQAYLLMDLVRGCDLSKWLITRREQILGVQGLELNLATQMAVPLPLDLVLGIAEQLALALDYAHSQPVSRGADGKAKVFGILHRDLKPANIMVETGREFRLGVPYVRIVDFGLAAEIQASLQSMSLAQRSSHLAGTPLYMAPEQWEGRTLTRGVDQWALAVLLYTMAAGRPPFSGPTETAIVMQICRADPEKPEHFSDQQWAALKKTLQIDRKQRHDSCLALVHALAKATPGTQGLLHSRPAPMPKEQSSTPSPPTSSPEPPDAPRAPVRRRRMLVAGALLAALAGLSAGGWWMWRSQQAGEAQSALTQALQRAEEGRALPAAALEKTLAELQQTTNRLRDGGLVDTGELDRRMQELRARQKSLAALQDEFQTALADAEQLTASEPSRAIAKLDELEKSYPELASAASPSLAARRQRAEEAKAEEERKAKLAQAGQTLLTNLTLADKARTDCRWEEVITLLEPTLKELGEAAHPSKAAAEALLAQARVQLPKKQQCEVRLAEADGLLQKQQFTEAGEAYKNAKTLWPEAPAAWFKRADDGLAAADAALSQQRYEAALRQAESALTEKRWQDAAAAFTQALAERKGDPRATEGGNEVQYRSALERAENLMNGKQWAHAQAAFEDALAAKQNDKTAKDGIAKAESAAKEERYQEAYGRGAKALQAKDWQAAEEAFTAALREKAGDSDASRLLAQTRQEAADARYEKALSEAKKAIEKQQWPAARAALQSAQQERPNDPAAAALLAEVTRATQPKPPAPPPPPEPAFGPEKVYGPYCVYANRIQGVPLDKNGELIPVRQDMDNEEYAEALKERKSWLKVAAGAKVRIEASGWWFSGPTGAWVTPDGKREDGRESLKKFRAFPGPDNSFNIAMLVVYLCDQEKPGTADYARIARENQVWTYTGKPIEFIAPAAGTLRLQQNRDGYFDVTQGALVVTVSVSPPAQK